MALNIKDELTDRLARELARETGESITSATRTAIQERLARIRRRQQRPAVVEELRAIARRGRARSTLDPRSLDEILGYNDGLSS
ncbi:MAG: type II toxin-antitoxin system VapB family antitoxin [Kineosporiaceae bacterium]